MLPTRVVKGVGHGSLKPTLKRKRDEGEDKLWASGSRKKADTGEGGAEALKKKQRVKVVIPPRPKEKDAPRAAKERA